MSRAATASPSSRWNAPWLRSPVRASWSARTRTSPWVRAFWSAIEAWPANSLVSSNSLLLNAASASPIRPMLSVPIVSPLTRSGTTIINSGSNGVPGTWIERGSRWASLDRTASPRPMAQPVIPVSSGLSWARIWSAKASRAMIARRTAADAIHLVDGQRVVRDDGLERIGDEVQDAGRLQGREQPLVDVEEPALALELVLELGLLAAEPGEVLGVDQRLDRRRREDRQRRPHRRRRTDHGPGPTRR